MSHCQLCEAIRSGTSPSFRRIMGDSSTQEIVADWGDKLLLLDIAPVRPGHSIIVSRQHHTSFIEDWSHGGSDLLSFVLEVESVVETVTGEALVVVEHGTGRDAETGAGCVEHAHLHMIPSQAPVVDSFLKLGIPLEPLDDVRWIGSVGNNEHYLYLRDTDGRQYAAMARVIASQLVRRVVAERHGAANWNWRDFVDLAQPLQTHRLIRESATVLEALYQHSASSGPTPRGECDNA